MTLNDMYFMTTIVTIALFGIGILMKLDQILTLLMGLLMHDKKRSE
jgi:hypothetical protein